jgi:hypothetical protein
MAMSRLAMINRRKMSLLARGCLGSRPKGSMAMMNI